MLNGEIRALNRHLENIYYTAEQPEAPVSIKVTALKREEDWKLGYQPVSWIVRGTANVLARADDAISYQTHLWVTVSNGVKSRDYYIEGGHFTKQEKAFTGKTFRHWQKSFRKQLMMTFDTTRPGQIQFASAPHHLTFPRLNTNIRYILV